MKPLTRHRKNRFRQAIPQVIELAAAAQSAISEEFSMSGRGNGLLFAGMALVLGQTAVAAEKVDTAVAVTRDKAAVLWRNPLDLSSRNLFYGSGGEQHQPAGDYTFVKEDLAGTNPKFVVRDAKGVKWSVKLGIEAQPE